MAPLGSPQEIDQFLFQDANFTMSGGDLTVLNGLSVLSRADFSFFGGAVFDAQGTSLINQSRFFVNSGSTATISATSMTGSFNGDTTVLSSVGIGSVLDLSSLTQLTLSDTVHPAFAGRWLTVIASNDGQIDLSGLINASSTVDDAEDRLRFRIDSGGQIDLGALETTDRVRLEVVGASAVQMLSSLVTADETDVLALDGATINAPLLTVFSNGTVTNSVGGTFSAPLLTDFHGSDLFLDGPDVFSSGQLSNIDGARLIISEGQTFDRVSATTMNGTYAGSLTILSADGVGTLLDLSSLSQIAVADTAHSTMGGRTMSIIASNNGQIDLSGLVNASSVSDTVDRLGFRIDTGGQIDLAELETTDRVTFHVDGFFASLSLPSLVSANFTEFYPGGSATINAPMLNAIANGRVEPGVAGTLNAAQVTDFHGSLLILRSGATFNSGQLSNIDGARIFLWEGQTFDRVTATVMNGTYGGSTTVLSADGTGTFLDLSSLNQIALADTAHSTMGGRSISVVASNGGQIDLSGLVSAASVSDSVDRLRFRIDSGGQIDLGALESVNKVRVEVEGGVLTAAGFRNAQQTNFFVNAQSASTATQFNILGDLELLGGSTLLVNPGADFSIGGDFTFVQTNEADINLTNAVVQLDGIGGQLFEVASEDLGLVGPTTGNFGIGQLIVGQAGQATTVQLIDSIDNGNRSAPEVMDESLYLFGVNGEDGLRVLGGSTFALGGLNVYAFDDTANDFILLNDLFAPGEDLIAFDGGFLMLSAFLMGDYDADGFVGAADLDILLANWGDTVTAGNLALGDGSGDGLIGQADLQIVLDNWGTGTLPGGTVPEPGTLAGLAVLLFCTSRRRRR